MRIIHFVQEHKHDLYLGIWSADLKNNIDLLEMRQVYS